MITLSNHPTLLPPKTLGGRRPLRDEVPDGESLCSYCTAKCCRYFALPLDEPNEPQDFDFMRWFLLHEAASIFVDGETWYLLVHTTCKHLQADHRCGIYHTRPQICRDYSTAECEYDENTVYDMYFETAEQMAEYVEARLSLGGSDVLRSPEPELLPILA
jgi:Fe-S-cluster containining protein